MPHMCSFSAHHATDISHRLCAKFSQHGYMSSDEPVTAKLKALREQADPPLSVRAMAEMLGIPSSSYAFYESGAAKGFKKSLLPVEFAIQVANILGARGVDKQQVLALAGMRPDFVPRTEPEQLADQLDAVLLPEIEVGYSMGGGADVADFPVVSHVPFSRSWLRSITQSSASELYVARGEGDSMMPTLLDGDIVIIDRGQRTMRQQDRIWALSYGGFSMIKRVRALSDGSLQINSDNAAVSPIVATDGEAYLIGRVVAVVRRM